MKTKRKTLEDRINWLFKTRKAREYFEEERESKMNIWNEIWRRYKDWNNWKDLADRVYSEYIRLKKSKNWICTCITCWWKHDWKQIQNWHFITRWILTYRFDEDNCRPQCMRCNVYLNWNYQRYTLKMLEMFWKEKVLEMMNNKKDVEYKQWRYEQHIMERYKEIKILYSKIK